MNPPPPVAGGSAHHRRSLGADWISARTLSENGERFTFLSTGSFVWPLQLPHNRVAFGLALPFRFATECHITLKSGARGRPRSRHQRFRHALIVGQFASRWCSWPAPLFIFAPLTSSVILAAAGIRAPFMDGHSSTASYAVPIRSIPFIGSPWKPSARRVSSVSISSYTPFFNWVMSQVLSSKVATFPAWPGASGYRQ